ALALDQGEGGEAVAQEGGACEIEILGGLAHIGLEMVLDAAGLAGEELTGILAEAAIGFQANLAGAGTGAAVDPVLQARAGAAGVKAVRAIAEEEGLLEAGNGAADGGGRGEGPKIMAWPSAGATMLGELRGLVIGGDQDIGEALVVAQQHVEAGLQALD